MPNIVRFQMLMVKSYLAICQGMTTNEKFPIIYSLANGMRGQESVLLGKYSSHVDNTVENSQLRSPKFCS